MKHELRFRQVHLDFHTSPLIDGIGAQFDKKRWQECLQTGHVDSITCFSCCHHGWSYHPTKVGGMHPGLKFDLLRAQIDACHEIGVRVPIYLTAGVNNRVAEMEPGWREVTPDGRWVAEPLMPGFKKLCFNSPYLDYLCRLVEEAARLFPDADGMFFDIISQGECCCPACMADMRKEGYNPENSDDRLRFARRTLKKYLKNVTEAARSVHADFPVFHNGTLLTPGNRDLLPYFSHKELESLPTGGWGYDHFPLLAAYCRTQPEYDFLGMTGKFHTSWGEFGGFKSPNALRYECDAMIAQGAKCSVGDQLHPAGFLDESTYRLIGEAYADVEQKEPWCRHAVSATSVAILSNIGFKKDLRPDEKTEIGLSRFLLESHIPFDRLDDVSDLSPYKLIFVADDLRPDDALKAKLNDFLQKGGKLVVSGMSIWEKDHDTPAFPLPGTFDGPTELVPNFIRAAEDFVPGSVTSPFVMYRASMKFKVKSGTSLGKVYDPYFNRTYDHFCSHQHTPFRPEESGYDAGVMTGDILYFAHPVFLLYGLYGTVVLKQFMQNALKAFAGEILPVTTSLPSQGRVTLMQQKEEKRFVAHALFANTILRGMEAPPIAPGSWSPYKLEVIEDLNPLYNVSFTFRLPEKIGKVTLEPQGREIPFTENADGSIGVTLESLVCHQMIVLHYA